jgi:hypothetical protein
VESGPETRRLRCLILLAYPVGLAEEKGRRDLHSLFKRQHGDAFKALCEGM